MRTNKNSGLLLNVAFQFLGSFMIGVLFFVAVEKVNAWTEPTVAPPGGNVGAPINTGSLSQTKTGGLDVNSSLAGNFIARGNSVFAGTIQSTGIMEIMVDDADSQLRFQDPYNAWYSMGIDQSDSLKFKIGYGGSIGDNDFFVMQTNGNIGIGMAAPTEKLQVNGAIMAKAGNPSAFNGNHVGYTFDTETDGGMFSPADGTVVFATNGAERARIISTGNIGVGTTSPTQKLEVNGNVMASGFYYSASDVNLKKDINQIGGALDKVLRLRGVKFRWKDNDVESYGFIAQEVEEVFPELVNTDQQTGLKSIQYSTLTAPIVEAIKEQQAQIEKQQQMIEELKKEVESLKNQANR
jgi:hypothetical protein